MAVAVRSWACAFATSPNVGLAGRPLPARPPPRTDAVDHDLCNYPPWSLSFTATQDGARRPRMGKGQFNWAIGRRSLLQAGAFAGAGAPTGLPAWAAAP